MRLNGARTNTHGKKIQGVMNDIKGFRRGVVFARFTSDAAGETLSLECEGEMIAVPFEAVERLIDETRKDKP